MLSAEQRSRLTVVLVGARNPGNIGAAARAMRDFGFSDLRVVNAFAPPFEAARLTRSSDATELLGQAGVAAVGAGDILQTAQRFDRLGDAIADCTLVVATTAIGERELTHPVITLQQAAPQIREALSAGTTDGFDRGDLMETQSEVGRVALLFGSEKTGLTNDQLSHAELLLTIPLFQPEGRHLSMNLGQAVAVCLYELGRRGFDGARTLPETQTTPATAADRERLLLFFAELLENSGYSRRFPANARDTVLRKLVGRMAASRLEVSTWMGILRQFQRWATREPHNR